MKQFLQALGNLSVTLEIRPYPYVRLIIKWTHCSKTTKGKTNQKRVILEQGEYDFFCIDQ